jgi:hypothetical protein
LYFLKVFDILLAVSTLSTEPFLTPCNIIDAVFISFDSKVFLKSV